MTDGNVTEYTKEGLNLIAGHNYFVRVAAVNKAGLVATHESDGVIVDDTPPVVGCSDIQIHQSFVIVCS